MRLLRYQEAAELLAISRSTLKQLIAKGHLRPVQVATTTSPRGRRLRSDDVEALMEPMEQEVILSPDSPGVRLEASPLRRGAQVEKALRRAVRQAPAAIPRGEQPPRPHPSSRRGR